MIWTVVLWLGMQGQAQWPTDDQGQLQNLCMYSNNGGDWRPCGPIHATTAPKNYNAPPNLIEPIDPPTPAEHVFEIRTKHQPPDKLVAVCAWLTACDDCERYHAVMKETTSGARACWRVRVTHELWLDGKRLGIIKGLD